MNLPSESDYKQLHDIYVGMTGHEYPLSFGARSMWERWLYAGFKPNDLSLVIRYIKARVRSGKRQRESFKFMTLIGDTDKFADDLCMARAEARQKQGKFDPGKAGVLKSTGRQEKPLKDTAKTAYQIIQESKALEDFRKFRDSL